MKYYMIYDPGMSATELKFVFYNRALTVYKYTTDFSNSDIVVSDSRDKLNSNSGKRWGNVKVFSENEIIPYIL